MTTWQDIETEGRPVPLHVREGIASEWRRWFAWRPARLEQGGRVWLRSTWRRRFYPPIWFTPPAPVNGWLEYSDERRSRWEDPSPPSKEGE